MPRHYPTIVNNEQSSLRIPFDIADYLNQINQVLNMSMDHLEVTFLTKLAMADLNHQYFNQAIPTDTITFNLSPESSITGDIYICLEVVNENAAEFKSTFINELKLVLIHSMLHLLNYKDDTPETARVMVAKQEEIWQTLQKNEAI